MSDVEPLLSTQKDVYDRFTTAQKRAILALVIFAGIISRKRLSQTCDKLKLNKSQALSSSSLVPLVPLVAKDLHTSGVLITLANTHSYPLDADINTFESFSIGLYIFIIAISALCWAPYSGFCTPY